MSISGISSANSLYQQLMTSQSVGQDADGDNDGSGGASRAAAAVKSPSSYNAMTGASNRIDIMA